MGVEDPARPGHWWTLYELPVDDVLDGTLTWSSICLYMNGETGILEADDASRRLFDRALAAVPDLPADFLADWTRSLPPAERRSPSPRLRWYSACLTILDEKKMVDMPPRPGKDWSEVLNDFPYPGDEEALQPLETGTPIPGVRPDGTPPPCEYVLGRRIKHLNADFFRK